MTQSVATGVSSPQLDLNQYDIPRIAGHSGLISHLGSLNHETKVLKEIVAGRDSQSDIGVCLSDILLHANSVVSYYEHGGFRGPQPGTAEKICRALHETLAEVPAGEARDRLNQLVGQMTVYQKQAGVRF